MSSLMEYIQELKISDICSRCYLSNNIKIIIPSLKKIYIKYTPPSA